MFNFSKSLGQLGEDAAMKFLKKQGYKILDRNFQNSIGRRKGEIDIIALDNKEKELVFAEVKTREKSKYGNTLPEENITYPKLLKLQKIAQIYINLKKMDDVPYRFDALSVWIDENGKQARIKHIKSL